MVGFFALFCQQYKEIINEEQGDNKWRASSSACLERILIAWAVILFFVLQSRSFLLGLYSFWVYLANKSSMCNLVYQVKTCDSLINTAGMAFDCTLGFLACISECEIIIDRIILWICIVNIGWAISLLFRNLFCEFIVCLMTHTESRKELFFFFLPFWTDVISSTGHF